MQSDHPSWPKLLVNSICLSRSAGETEGRMRAIAWKKSSVVTSGALSLDGSTWNNVISMPLGSDGYVGSKKPSGVLRNLVAV